MLRKTPERLKKVIRPFYYGFYRVRLFFLNSFVYKSRIRCAQEIPIVINNRNRLTFLRRLIASLEIRGYKNIFILDNDSTYPPLLEFYRTCPYSVTYLGNNYGWDAIWRSGVYRRFYRDYYVYTDSDLELIEECPDDFLDVFLERMKADFSIMKIGLSLKLDDIPDHYIHKESVIRWEQQFYVKRVDERFFQSNVDTTFALYRPGVIEGANIYLKMYRSAFPYEVRHLPWYLDTNSLDEEEMYYIKHAQRKTHWTEVH